jgi:hypothetical protein
LQVLETSLFFGGGKIIFLSNEKQRGHRIKSLLFTSEALITERGQTAT